MPVMDKQSTIPEELRRRLLLAEKNGRGLGLTPAGVVAVVKALGLKK